jgi:hypothetical protein
MSFCLTILQYFKNFYGVDHVLCFPVISINPGESDKTLNTGNPDHISGMAGGNIFIPVKGMKIRQLNVQVQLFKIHDPTYLLFPGFLGESVKNPW